MLNALAATGTGAGMEESSPASASTTTLGYGDPEFVDGALPSPDSDVYAFGVVVLQVRFRVAKFVLRESHRCASSC
jgi:hypothetical protein